MPELNIEATVDNLDRVTDFLHEHLEALDCPLPVQLQIDMAVEELYINIAKYAYAPKTGSATIRVETEREPKAVTITFLDSGVPFDPLKKPDPDITASLEARPIGGLGIYMVKQSMDGVEYRHRDGMNVLTIRKVLG